MVRELAIMCNTCKTVLYETGECLCEDIALIRNKDKNVYAVYANDENAFEIVEIFRNGNSIVKILDTLHKNLGVDLEVSPNVDIKKLLGVLNELEN